MSIRYLVHGKLDSDFIKKIFSTFNNTNIDVENIIVAFDKLSSKIDSEKIDAECKIPDHIMDELFNMNVFALFVPKELNGVEANMRDFCKVITKISEKDVSIATTIVPHSGMGVKSVLYFANDDQKKLLLEDLSKKRNIIAFALTEIQAGSDVANHSTNIKKIDENNFVLNGVKHFITNTSFSKTIVVIAKCPDLTKIPGGSTFLYLKPDEQGLFINHPYDKMGMRGSDTTELVFKDIKVSKDRIFGIAGKAINQFNMLVDSGRMGVSSVAIGVSNRILKLCKQKIAKIANNTLISNTISEIETKLFQMEATLNITALSHDLANPDCTIYTAINKLFCTKSCQEIINKAFYLTTIDDLFDKQEIYFALRDTLILRVTEGPNEVINFKAGLEIITSLINQYEGENSIKEFLTDDFKRYSTDFDIILKQTSEIIKEIGEKYSNFSSNQFILFRIIDIISPVFILYSVFLYYSCMIENNKCQKEQISTFIETTFIEMKERFYNAIKKEKNQIDDVVSYIFENKKMDI